MWWSFKPYVSVEQRRAKARREAAKLAKKGHICCPVEIGGRTIARTFWGKAWCDNLESYSDFENRLPRGRTYVRNGSVVDLQIAPGRVTALVSGSDLYKVKIDIKPATRPCWDSLKRSCAGQIGSLIELLQGRLSQGVMQIMTRREGGLFPKPAEITKSCSCPDWADMCKHVAAVLYGVGARLDEQPELLFLLRKVDHLELITQAGDVTQLESANAAGAGQKTIADTELADVFGIELDAPAVKTRAAAPTPALSVNRPASKPRRKKTAVSVTSGATPKKIRKGTAAAKKTATRTRKNIAARTAATR